MPQGYLKGNRINILILNKIKIVIIFKIETENQVQKKTMKKTSKKNK